MLKDVQVFRMRNRPLSGASSFRPARAMRAPSGLLLIPPVSTNPADHGADPDPHGKVCTEQPPRHAGKEPHQGAQSGEGSPSPEGDAQYLQFISPSATWRYSLGRDFIRRARRSVLFGRGLGFTQDGFGVANVLIARRIDAWWL